MTKPITRKDVISDEALSHAKEYMKSIEEIRKEVDHELEVKEILTKRDTALRKILAHIMWHYLVEHGEEATIEELERLFSVYKIQESLIADGHQLTERNQHWFVNKKIDAFLEQFDHRPKQIKK